MPSITPTDLARAVADRVAADMHAAGLSVAELAARAGIPTVTLTRALDGGTFRMGALAEVAQVLGRRPSEWFAAAEAGTR